jgi:AraC-like DNA-binding protein
MNMSFSEYTRGLKTREAQRLLKCTDKSVTEIAQMLDYATSSHFIKDFKKEKNMSPGKYRSGQKSLEKGTNF